MQSGANYRNNKALRYLPQHVRNNHNGPNVPSNQNKEQQQQQVPTNDTSNRYIPRTSYWGGSHSHSSRQKQQQQTAEKPTSSSGFVKLSSIVRKNVPNSDQEKQQHAVNSSNESSGRTSPTQAAGACAIVNEEATSSHQECNNITQPFPDKWEHFQINDTIDHQDTTILYGEEMLPKTQEPKFNKVFCNDEIFKSNETIDTIENEDICVQTYQWPAQEKEEVDSECQDWRNSEASLVEQFRYMLYSNIRTDCSIIVGTPENQQLFRCHKLHLSRASSVLDSIIFGASNSGEVIRVTNIEPKIFKDLLEYIYSDHIELENIEQALALCHTANFYRLTRLQNICVLYLCSNLGPDTFWPTLEFVLLIEDPSSFRQQCLQYLQTNTQACLNASNFMLVKLPCLVWLLQQENLNIDSEMDVILAAICWAIKETETGWLFHGPSSPDLLRRALGPAFSLLRFLSLTPTQFSVGLSDTELLSEHEKLAILINLVTPGHMPLPEGVCTETNSRSCKKSQPDLFKLTTPFQIAFRPVIKSNNIRGICMPSPFTVSSQIKVNKDTNVLGFELASQYKSKEDLPKNIFEERFVAYEENIKLTLYQKIKNAEIKMITETTYNKTASYNAEVGVMFKTPVTLMKDTSYILDVQFLKEGTYCVCVRAKYVCINGVQFKFGYHEKDSLIESVIFC